MVGDRDKWLDPVQMVRDRYKWLDPVQIVRDRNKWSDSVKWLEKGQVVGPCTDC